jgi:flavodoxin
MPWWLLAPGVLRVLMDENKEGQGGGGGPGGKPDDTEKPPGKAAAGGGSGDETGDPDESSIPENLKGYIQKLRNEAATNRKTNKALEAEKTSLAERVSNLESGLKKALGIEDEEASPEEVAKVLKDQTETQGLEIAILESAIEHGIPKEHVKYFRFLLGERLGAMEDGEELTDEMMGEIVTQVKSVAGPKMTSTGVGDGQGAGKKPPAGGGGEITVEQFKKMSTTEKTQLYIKDQPLYERLLAESRK